MKVKYLQDDKLYQATLNPLSHPLKDGNQRTYLCVVLFDNENKPVHLFNRKTAKRRLVLVEASPQEIADLQNDGWGPEWTV
jgi:hypothetical protein